MVLHDAVCKMYNQHSSVKAHQSFPMGKQMHAIAYELMHIKEACR